MRMLLEKLSRINFSILSRRLNSKSIIVRWKGFTHSENLFTKFDWEFARNVLKNTDGCILYDPLKNYNPSEKFIQNDETILNLIQLNKSCDLNKNNDMKKLLNEFDRKCLQNLNTWKIDQILFVSDIWDSFRPFRLCFSVITPKRCLEHLKEIPNGQKLQLLHYLGYSEQPISEANQANIIQILDRHLDDLSLEEANFYYSALVRCECKASEKYAKEVRRMIDHLKGRSLRDENQIAVSSALKAIRKLSTQTHIEDLKALQKILVPLIREADTYLLTHIAHLGLPQRVFNRKLLDLVIEKSLFFVIIKSKAIRLKDVERILLVIATYRKETYEAANKFCKVVQPFLKDSISTIFPLDLIQCIASLAIIGEVDHALINWALNYGENINIPPGAEHHFLVIDSFAKVNLQSAYNGQLLSNETYAKLELRAQTQMNNDFGLEIRKDLMTIFKMNNHYVSVVKAIPFSTQPDLIFIYNTQTHKTVEFVQPNKCGTIVHASELYNKEPHLVAIAIVTYGKMSTLHSISSNFVIGRLQLHIDQLKLLGFDVMLWKVSQTRWEQADLGEKRQLLQNRLWKKHIQLFEELRGTNEE